jgi:hypothetical protein
MSSTIHHPEDKIWYTITHIVGEKPKTITIKVNLNEEKIRELNKKIGELK